MATAPYPSPAYPLHVILGAFPIACFSGALLTDITYANSYNMQWANFSVWLITAGLVMGVLAAIAGIVDYVANRRTRRSGRIHSWGNALVLLLSLWNVFVHSRDGYTSVVPTGIVLSAIVTILVLITSWLGTNWAWRNARAGATA